MITPDLKIEPRNFEIAADGICRPMTNPTRDLSRCLARRPYRFYRFLCDLEDIATSVSEELERLRMATILTRHFLNQATWITEACPPPDPETCVANRVLSREPDFLFEVHAFSWLPQTSNVHSHGTWSIVAILGDATTGREQNYFWTREDDGSKPDYAAIKPMSKQVLEPGDILGLTAGAIHNIKSLPPQNAEHQVNPKPTLMFNIFGAPNPDNRYLFNPFENTLKGY